MASDKMLGSFDQKSAPEDNDLLVEYDAAASKVKNVKFGGVWNWIVKKLTSAVINELQTSSKNVVGAINELNSKTLRLDTSGTFMVTGACLIYAHGLYWGDYNGLYICNPIAKEKCTIDTILRCPHLNMLSINPNTKQITFSFDNYGGVLDIFLF